MNARVLLSCLISLAGGSLPLAMAMAQCPPHWSSQFALNGVDGPVFKVVSFDPDGAGPDSARALIGGSLSSTVAQFDGQGWQSLGDAAGFGSAFALTAFDPDGDGPLPAVPVAAMTTASFTGFGVFKFEAGAWTRLGAETAFATVREMAFMDPDGDGPLPPRLFLAGTSGDGTTTRSGLYELGPSGWTFVGDDPSDTQVLALLSFDEDGPGPLPARLLVGGNFNRGTQTITLRAWDGASWTNLLSSADGVSVVTALGTDDAAGGALVVGGSFTHIGASNVRFLARKVGDSWQGYGDGPPLVPSYLAIGDPDGPGPAPRSVFIASASAAGGAAPNVFDFDGADWRALGTGAAGFVQDMAIADPDGDGPLPTRLLVVGEFPSVGGVSATNLAAWDGRAWRALGSFADLGTYRNPGVLKVFDDDGAGPLAPALYAAGGLTSIGGVAVRELASFDGQHWEGVPGLRASRLTDLIEFDPDGDGPLPRSLVACGLGLLPAGQGSTSVAMRTAGVWNRLAAGPGDANSTIHALAVFDEDGDGPGPSHLYAGGNFFVIRSGVTLRSIARWNGAVWEPVGGGGGGLSGTVNSMVVFDEDGPGPIAPALFVGGAISSAFNGAASVLTGAVAKWNGTTWQASVALASNRPNSTVQKLKVFDADGPGPRLPALYATGGFTVDLNSRRYSGFARLESGAWRPAMPAAFTTPLQGSTGAMGEFDLDGDGPEPPALLVCGGFSFFPPGNALSTSQSIARYDAVLDRWTQLPFNTPPGNTTDIALTSFRPAGESESLFVSARFNSVDGVNSHCFARYGDGNDLGITRQPEDATVPSGAPAELRMLAAGGSPISYQWRRDGQPLSDAPGLTGSQTPTLRIARLTRSDAGPYDCVITDACGTLTTRTAQLTVLCPADFNELDGVNSDDLGDYITCFFAPEPCPGTDFNRDGQVDPDDLADFVTAYFVPCP